ncbi:dephospho-CoA kinase [Cryobacterium psychrophilum]|uniref:Dephospho-CoA kinase n=1 Tax=Cryobacterium psychrophilum TaxID=41988 RepID=A0A4Y8KQJ1_9MICO|nr:dephospho-CoA kinase [Cryobacterium psychrophilum]TDW28589.1 dephospho-CoA kinase [Cryobacterium psychrophilum]TFD80415.1 dephospho-CoA kinase [Cryobacterium psychrophilum]
MYLIGLTGGIASGKSTVAKRLAELGAVHIDADRLARDVVEPDTPGLAAIATEFGSSVIQPDGSLDRAALGAIIFSDATKRDRLNAITHPLVWSRTLELIREAEENDPFAVVVYDVALLAEAAADRRLAFDLIVVVHADAETRIVRMIRDRGLSRAEAAARISAQASDSERLAIADVVIDNTGTVDATRAQADMVWRRALLALT